MKVTLELFEEMFRYTFERNQMLIESFEKIFIDKNQIPYCLYCMRKCLCENKEMYRKKYPNTEMKDRKKMYTYASDGLRYWFGTNGTEDLNEKEKEFPYVCKVEHLPFRYIQFYKYNNKHLISNYVEHEYYNELDHFFSAGLNHLYIENDFVFREKGLIDLVEEYQRNKEENKKHKCYIVHKKIVEESNLHLLKLNRKSQRLEVFRKCLNQKLHDFYSIKKEYDSSDYVIYEWIKSFECLFGSEETPTPEGIFKISKKSNEEYLSEYREGYDKVKFFEYLVIFEDYFIHSDLYSIDITRDMLESNSNIRAISEKDNSTAGCIRVSQEDVHWLVEHIQEGTTIIM